MTWRDKAKSVISGVIRANPGADQKALRRLLTDAYPFGERRHFPYKVWCDEVANQLGTKKAKAAKDQDAASDLFVMPELAKGASCGE